MNEFAQGWSGTLALLPSVVFSAASWIGGRPKGRIWKRVIAPVSFCLLTIGVSVLAGHFKWWFFLSFPAYLISCSIGYGGDTWTKKLARRSLWSFVRTAASLTFMVFTGAWLLFLVQLIVCLLTVLMLGILNPLVAPAEEGLINFVSVMFVPYMVI